MAVKDTGLDAILGFHGQTHMVGKDGSGYAVIFTVHRVPVTAEKPHGLDYSFVLLSPDNARIAAIDNAHPVPGRAKGDLRLDHKHRFKTVRPYDYHDASTLLGDFYDLVESVLKELGANE